MWLKNANNAAEAKDWAPALTYCNELGDSGYSDWRLPNYMELVSLLDLGYADPALSNAAGTEKWSPGNAFTNVQPSYYWTSTTFAGYTDLAWVVNLYNGKVNGGNKTNSDYYVWPVRAGQ